MYESSSGSPCAAVQVFITASCNLLASIGSNKNISDEENDFISKENDFISEENDFIIEENDF